MMVSLLERARRANPRHTETLHALNRLTASDEQSVVLLEKIIEIDPAHSRAWMNLINTQARLGKIDVANQLVRNMLIDVPDMPIRMSSTLTKSLGDLQLSGEIVFENWQATENSSHGRKVRAALLADLGALAEAEYLYRLEAASTPEGLPESKIFAEILASNVEARLLTAKSAAESDSPPRGSGFALAAAFLTANRPQEALDTISRERKDLLSPTPKFRPAFAALGDPEMYVVAEALESLGRVEEARQLWTLALNADYRGFALTWQKPMNNALLLARLGQQQQAVASFQTAYDQGFRFLYSMNCDNCVDDGFIRENGLLSPLVKLPGAAEIVARIQAENQQSLEDFNRRFGILNQVRNLMNSEQPLEQLR